MKSHFKQILSILVLPLILCNANVLMARPSKKSLAFSQEINDVTCTVSDVRKKLFKKKTGHTFGRNHQALYLEIKNNSDKHLYLAPNSVTIPLASVEEANVKVARSLFYLLTGGVVGIGAAALFWPAALYVGALGIGLTTIGIKATLYSTATSHFGIFLTSMGILCTIPAVAMAVLPFKGAQLVYEFDEDQNEKGKSINRFFDGSERPPIIPPNGTLRRYMFVHDEDRDSNFSIILFDHNTQPSTTFNIAMSAA